MGERARLRESNSFRTIPTITAAAALPVPDTGDCFYISGSTAITSLVTSQIEPGRIVTFVGVATGDGAFSSPTAKASATSGQYVTDAGGHTLDKIGIIEFRQLDNGVWVMNGFTALA